MAEKSEDVLDIIDNEEESWVDGDLTATRAMENKTSTPKMSKGDLLRMIDFSPISVLSELSPEMLSDNATRQDESAEFSLPEEPLPASADQRMVIGTGSVLAVQVDEPSTLPFMQESNNQDFSTLPTRAVVLQEKEESTLSTRAVVLRSGSSSMPATRASEGADQDESTGRNLSTLLDSSLDISTLSSSTDFSSNNICNICDKQFGKGKRGYKNLKKHKKTCVVQSTDVNVKVNPIPPPPPAKSCVAPSPAATCPLGASPVSAGTFLQPEHPPWYRFQVCLKYRLDSNTATTQEALWRQLEGAIQEGAGTPLEPQVCQGIFDSVKHQFNKELKTQQRRNQESIVELYKQI